MPMGLLKFLFIDDLKKNSSQLIIIVLKLIRTEVKISTITIAVLVGTARQIKISTIIINDINNDKNNNIIEFLYSARIYQTRYSRR